MDSACTGDSVALYLQKVLSPLRERYFLVSARKYPKNRPGGGAEVDSFRDYGACFPFFLGIKTALPPDPLPALLVVPLVLIVHFTEAGTQTMMRPALSVPLGQLSHRESQGCGAYLANGASNSDLSHCFVHRCVGARIARKLLKKYSFFDSRNLIASVLLLFLGNRVAGFVVFRRLMK